MPEGHRFVFSRLTRQQGLGALVSALTRANNIDESHRPFPKAPAPYNSVLASRPVVVGRSQPALKLVVGLSIHAHMHVHLWTFVLWLLSASVCEKYNCRRGFRGVMGFSCLCMWTSHCTNERRM